MTPDAARWGSLKRLFERASALPPEEQGLFLENACSDDPRAQAQLASLLAAAEKATPLFDSLADAVLSLAPWSEGELDDEPTRGSDPRIGRTIRQYRIEEMLGRGGMGVVYRAHDKRLDRTVALKFLPRRLGADEEAVERFLLEAKAEAALDHPNLCNVHEIGEDDEGGLFIAMAYYEGETLTEKISRGPLPIEEATNYARQIAAGLATAHARGIVHRDVKPGNVIVTPEGMAKVLDFGLAKLRDVTLTSAGVTMGTVAYMSPEQARGDGVDHRTDLWSLGVVLYEMLTGVRPFKGSKNAIVLTAIKEEEPRPPSTLRRDIPPDLEALVTGLLAKDPEQRPSTSEVVGDAAAPLPLPRRAPAPVHPLEQFRRWRAWRHPVATLITLLVLATSLALGSFLVLSPGDAYAVDNARQKFIVLAHGAGGVTATEEELAASVESQLTRMLTDWKEARAVPNVAKAGFIFDLGFSGRLRSSLRESIEIARAAGVGTLVSVTVRIQADTAQLEAQLYDVATRDRLGPGLTSTAVGSDFVALSKPVAAEILDFAGAPEELLSFKQESKSLQAVKQAQAGQAALERWRLESAERSLRAALTEDSTFARAHHLLALTLYWQAAREETRLQELGGPIRRHANAARRLSAPLVYRDSLHAEALAAFANGAYQESRELYKELVRTDSTDTYAWLMLGSVEYRDPWAVAGPDGRLTARGDLNLARRAFTRTIRLSPDFFLGYGHLFDMYRQLADAALSGWCHAYTPPSDDVILVWEPGDPTIQVASCAVMRDSIERVDRAGLESLTQSQLVAGADRLLEDALIEIQRWSEFAPDHPLPEEELAAWLLAKRELVAHPGNRPALDSLSARALEHLERALALRPDTTPEDLVRLGAQYLSVGDLERALVLTENGVAAAKTSTGSDTPLLPTMAANVFLATGQLGKALDVTLPRAALSRRATPPDPVDNRRHDLLVDVEYARLRVLGAVGLGGDSLQNALTRIDQTWSDAGYDDRQKGWVREYLTGRIRPALTLDDRVMVEWFGNREPSDPIMAGHLLASSDPEAARLRLEQAIDSVGPEPPNPITAYLIGGLAQRLEAFEQAIEFFDHIDRAGLEVRSMSEAWGLWSLSYLRRAESYEALGDTGAARLHYERFLELWQDADDELQPVVTEARLRLDGRL